MEHIGGHWRHWSTLSDPKAPYPPPRKCRSILEVSEDTGLSEEHSVNWRCRNALDTLWSLHDTGGHGSVGVIEVHWGHKVSGGKVVTEDTGGHFKEETEYSDIRTWKCQRPSW